MAIGLLLLMSFIIIEAVWLKRLKNELKRKDVKINMLECAIIKLKKG